MIHLDTSALVDSLTGKRRSARRFRQFVDNGERLHLSALVLFEWLRGPRTEDERQAVDAFFELDQIAVFGKREAERAAGLYGRVKGARQRQADLAIAACAIEGGASLWTLNRSDFDDVPELTLFGR